MSSAPISRPIKAAAKVLAALLSKFPARVLAVVKWELQPTGRLDYRPARIEMALGSSWQVYRLRSCSKEPETVAWLEREFQVTDCLYDIGANVGAYSLVGFAATAGRGKIVAFEPGFTTFAELCRNIALNHAEDAILPLPIALGAVNGISTFGYSDTAPGAARHEWGNGDHEEPLELKLRLGTFRLDGLIDSLQLPQPNLIKLDVDGPELEVLTGAERTLRDPRLRSCLVELDDALDSSRSARELLEAAGFTMTSRHQRGGGGGGTLYNVIFSRA